MKILLFGKNGQVGWELNRSLLPLGEVVALGRKDSDFSDPESLRGICRKIMPDVIVNAAAYTNVEKAESEQELAHRVNAVAPGVLAEVGQSIKALMVHYSTDYVFDGTAEVPYRENAEPNPLNAYGRTKNDGEIAVRNACPRHLIVRTSWVYSSRGRNFVRSMIDLMNKKEVLHIVDDQIGAPTWARYIADASTSMIGSVMNSNQASADDMFGTYHLSSSGNCSWYDLTTKIRLLLEKNGFSRPVEILPTTTEEYKIAARRPLYSVLDNEKIHRFFAVNQVNWEYALELCLAEM